MKKLNIGTKVKFCYGKTYHQYEIIRNEIKNNKEENLYFGTDNNGNVLHTATGNFDYILAEYDENRKFIKNITCNTDDIEIIK